MNQSEFMEKYIDEDYAKYSKDSDLVKLYEYLLENWDFEKLESLEIYDKLSQLMAILLPKRVVDNFLSAILDDSNEVPSSETIK